MTLEWPFPHSVTVDHVVALVRNGSTKAENRVAACYRCNVWKGRGDALKFFWLVQATPVNLRPEFCGGYAYGRNLRNLQAAFRKARKKRDLKLMRTLRGRIGLLKSQASTLVTVD